MLERDIENYLVTQAQALGVLVRKVQWIGRRGAPDRVLMLPGGRLVWVEVKQPGAKPERHQAREHERMRAVGQTVVVVDSRDGVDGLLGAGA